MAVTDWYEENVEPGVRDVVRLLRDNGFNTVSSCDHDMSVTMEWYMPATVQYLAEFLVEHGFDGFAVVAKIGVVDGRWNRWLRVELAAYKVTDET